MRTRVFAAVLAAGVACAEPAALEVAVQINAVDIEALRLVLRRDDLDGEVFVDCELALGEAIPAACALEAGTPTWSDPSRASFVVFGDPGRAFAVELDGFRDQRSVTATRAVTRLPAREAERATLNLALNGRTEVRTRCSVTMAAPTDVVVEPSANADEQTAMIAVPVNAGGTFGLLVSVDGELARVLYRPGPLQCALEGSLIRDPAGDPSDPFDDDRWCRVSSGALVAGPLSAEGGVLVASLCARPAPTASSARLKIGLIGTAFDVRTLELGVSADRVTLPIIADLDGDGAGEIVVLVQDDAGPESEVRVLRIQPARGTVDELSLGAYGRIAFGGPAPPPIRFRGPNGAERLLIVGYPGPVGVYDGTRVDPLYNPDRSSWGQTLVTEGNALSLHEVRGQLLSSFRLNVSPQGVWSLADTSTVRFMPTIVETRQFRLPVGVTETGRPFVGLINNDLAVGWVAELNPRPEVLNVPGVLTSSFLLYANLDGAPGTELIVFAPDSSEVMAADPFGVPLAGWPLQFESGAAGRRRVLLTDLEPLAAPSARALRTAEVVGLNYRTLEVISLGAGSYDQAQWSWPSVDGGTRGWWAGPLDPLRLP